MTNFVADITDNNPFTTMNRKILVVDDEETLCEALKLNLELEGYEADVAYSAEEALALDLPSYSLILLDIMMGDISGIQLAKILRKRADTAGIPIIFCTARDSEDDMVEGLDLGADDYITKPYSIKNVLARIRTVLRRAGNASTASEKPANEEETLQYKSLVLSMKDKTCRVDGKEIPMPRKEFEIIHTMLQHPGRIFSREELIRLIWPEEVVVLDRVVDVNITRLRLKLGEYGKNIVTRRGYGYGFMD